MGRIYLDYEAFEQIATLEGGGHRYLSERWGWRFSYRHDRIRGYQPYNYLSGSQDQLRRTARYRPVSWTWESGYRLALNDRHGLSEGGDF